MNEAAFAVQDHLAEPAQIDKIFRECFGHKLGPLETADLIGLDVVADSLDILFESYHDSKYRCCPLLRKMVSAGMLGKKKWQGILLLLIRGCVTDMSNHSSIKNKLKEYICQSANLTALEDDVELFNEGYVSSLFAIQLMMFIEKEFDIKIRVQDLDMDHFKSINAIADFIKAKTKVV